MARAGLRRGRSTDGRHRRRSGPGRGRVRRDLHAGLLPRADRRPAVRAGRRPRTAAAAGGGGDRRRHRRRPGGRLQRGPGRGGGLPRLPAALRHDGAAGASAARSTPPRSPRGRPRTPRPSGRSPWRSTRRRTGSASTGAPTGRPRRRRTPPVRPYLPRAATRTSRCWCSPASSTRSRPRPRPPWSPGSSPTPGGCWCATASTSPPSATPTTARSGSSGTGSPPRASSSRARCGPAPATYRRCGHWASFPTALPGDATPRRVARAAALTVADLPDRWWNNYSGHGVGLRGGTWRYAGSDRVRFTLDAGAAGPGAQRLRERRVGPLRPHDGRRPRRRRGLGRPAAWRLGHRVARRRRGAHG